MGAGTAERNGSLLRNCFSSACVRSVVGRLVLRNATVTETSSAHLRLLYTLYVIQRARSLPTGDLATRPPLNKRKYTNEEGHKREFEAESA